MNRIVWTSVILLGITFCKNAKKIQKLDFTSSQKESKKGDQTTSFEESIGVLPVAKLEIAAEGKTYHCMAAYLQPQRLVTAAHCLRPLETLDCSQKVKVQFFVKTDTGVKLGQAMPLCQKIHVAPKDDESRDLVNQDLGHMDISKSGKFPSKPMDFHKISSAEWSQQKLFYFRIKGDSVVRLSSQVLEVGDDGFFISDMRHEPGLSGSPLLFLPSTDGEKDSMAWMLGLHLGQVAGFARAATLETVKAYLGGIK